MRCMPVESVSQSVISRSRPALTPPARSPAPPQRHSRSNTSSSTEHTKLTLQPIKYKGPSRLLNGCYTFGSNIDRANMVRGAAAGEPHTPYLYSTR